MRSEHIVLSAIHFFMCLLLFLIGMGCVLLPFAPEIRFTVVQFLEKQEGTLYLGLSFIALSGLLFTGLYFLYRRQFYQVLFNSKKIQVTVEKPLLRKFIETYWKQRFPNEIVVQDLWFRSDGKWEFQVQLSCLNLERQEEILLATEKELGDLLQKQFGYSNDFILSVIS